MISDFDGKSPVVADSAFVAQTAHVIGDVEIQDRANVWPGTVVRGDEGKITIGRGTAVQDNCVLHCGSTPLTIGQDVLIGHGVIVHCREIGDCVVLGNGAILLNEAEIGEFSIVGAGSVVTPRTVVPPRSLVMGVPGRVIGEVSDERVEQTRRSVHRYADRAQRYKEQGF